MKTLSYTVGNLYSATISHVSPGPLYFLAIVVAASFVLPLYPFPSPFFFLRVFQRDATRVPLISLRAIVAIRGDVFRRNRSDFDESALPRLLIEEIRRKVYLEFISV